MELDINLKDGEKKRNICTSKSIPNYLYCILFLVILLLTTVVLLRLFPNGQGDTKEKEEETILTPWKKYIKAEKYLYLWEYYTPYYILQMCKDHNFTRVYLYIGAIDEYWDDYYSKDKFPPRGKIGSFDYPIFIKQLNEINVEVELMVRLGRNHNDFSKVDRVLKVVNMVKTLSNTVKIKALHFDQKPRQDQSYEKLLDMYVKVNEIFPTSAVLLGFWLNVKMVNIQSSFTNSEFYSKFSDCDTLVDAIMKVTNSTLLMAFNRDYTQVNTFMETLKTISKKHPKNEAKNAIEVSNEEGTDDGDTMYKTFLEDKDTFFNFIYDSSIKYGGITIHYYEEWYEALYCSRPDINVPYEGGEPKHCTQE